MNTKIIHSYKELIVWQKEIELVVAVYDMTKDFPKEEMFGLSSQIKRAAVSLPANIAEGRHRGSRKDFLQFIRIAYASAAELETEIYIAEKLGFCKKEKLDIVRKLLEEEMKMLYTIIGKLKAS